MCSRQAPRTCAERASTPKDIWVVWALSAIYDLPLGNTLTFKGGTSLTKVYKVVERFSEDIDLTYDIRELVPEPVQIPGTRQLTVAPNLSQCLLYRGLTVRRALFMDLAYADKQATANVLSPNDTEVLKWIRKTKPPRKRSQ
ncbi:hypothetical protein GSY71_01295 [Pusillimonas sp. TS35]|uniref:nucleotidyl transferase AbiEii/AbiGii toxin family protein n=1 Tax=Paracandidimonas lactea TaxID=2895524 RepID=UPI00136E7D0E|nr:nucleotidyl transferase AbiEii/AbiGii toxin family protein [Paracandidimonas lactea]MYN11788.1 hypothetical protein [Pusillimonas sp. TS35]